MPISKCEHATPYPKDFKLFFEERNIYIRLSISSGETFPDDRARGQRSANDKANPPPEEFHIGFPHNAVMSKLSVSSKCDDKYGNVETDRSISLESPWQEDFFV